MDVASGGDTSGMASDAHIYGDSASSGFWAEAHSVLAARAAYRHEIFVPTFIIECSDSEARDGRPIVFA